MQRAQDLWTQSVLNYIGFIPPLLRACYLVRDVLGPIHSQKNLKVSLKLLAEMKPASFFPPPPRSVLVLMDDLVSAVAVRTLPQRSWGLTRPRH